MPAKDAAKEDAPKVNDNAPEILEVKGRVVGPNGKPVKGAKVWLVLEPLAVKRTAANPRVVATTDADGAFAVTEKGTGRHRNWAAGAQVVATADGFGPAWAAANTKKDKSLELQLVKDEPINGRILTLEGKPIAGVRVRVLEVSVPTGPDLSNWLAELKANARPIHEVQPKYFHHEGRLFETDGELPGQPEAAVTNNEGRFRITGLGSERLVQLRIDGPTVTTVELPVMTRAAPAITVPEDPGDSRYGLRTYYGSTFDFAADPTQPFEGLVTDRETGKPIAGVTVRAARQWYEVKTVTDADGKYRLTGLPPGSHELIACPASDQAYYRMAVKGGEKASQKTAKLDFALTRGHWVTGKLVNLRTNKPEADAPVWYFPLADEPAYVSVPGSRAWSMDPTTHTRPDGTFRVVAYPCRGAIVANGWSGNYITAEQRPLQGDAESLDRGSKNEGTLSTSPAAYLGSYHAAAIVNVDPQKPKDYTITLDPGVTVSVKVLDPDGKPVTGAGAGGLASWSLWEPDQAAEIKVRQYNPDRPRAILFLLAEKGLGKLVEPKKGDAGPWDVKLEPVGTATGRLVDADGKPLANSVLQIHYRLPGHDAWTPSFAHTEVRTDDKGSFRLTNLVGGVLYSFRHSTDRGAGRSQHYEHVRLKAGETKELGDVKPRGE
jgi:protocatechuate 3,4-dioxygenase beta subunit